MSSLILDRRDFLQLSAVAGGGLMLGFSVGHAAAPAAAAGNSSAAGAATPFAPNIYVRIGRDGIATIISKNPETGQGVKTAFPMVIAEELEIDWKDVVVEQVGYDSRYPRQVAGGSGATPADYMRMRRAGAVVRELLIAAAAQKWSVPAAECFAEHGTVVHKPSGKKLPYGELVDLAATLKVPDEKDVKLKDRKDFKLLGTRIGGVDNQKIVTGQRLFGLDTKVPGMLYAVFEKCPAFGAKVAKANVDEVRKAAGVKHVAVSEGGGPFNGLVPGVAIVADSYWAAETARKQLKVEWAPGLAAELNESEAWDQKAAELAKGKATSTLHNVGDVEAILSKGGKVVEANYKYPFVAHATLEPQNCTAHFKEGKVEVWAPTQTPEDSAKLVAKTLGIDLAAVTLHMIRGGGGFGRRIMNDYAAEAAWISKQCGAPVKLVWNREDDMRHDFYRPGGYHHLRAAVDDSGKIAAWHNHFVTFTLGSARPTAGDDGKTNAPRAADGGNMSGDEFPGRFVPNFRQEMSFIRFHAPTGWWRAPGSCAYAWTFQCFIDELAHAAGRDTVEFRLDLLGEPREVKAADGKGQGYDAGRMRGVVELAAKKSNWGKKLPKGQGQGIAFHYSHRGYVAMVADVTVAKDGTLKVSDVTVAVDVGPIMNLSGAEAQSEGSVIDGLSAAWFQEITFEKGAAVQKNFADHPMLRIQDAPRVTTHFIQNDIAPTGLGEPVLPPIAPAVCNAIFAAIGKRIRELPITKTDLSWS